MTLAVGLAVAAVVVVVAGKRQGCGSGVRTTCRTAERRWARRTGSVGGVPVMSELRDIIEALSSSSRLARELHD